jgi:outer membrane autotransporter protein
MGIDYQIAPNVLFGLAGGGSNGYFSVPGRATSGSVQGGHIGAYSIVSLGSFYGSSTLSGSFYRNKETRTVAGFGGLGGETDRGSYDSRAVRTRLEIGDHAASIWGASMTPFVALEIADLRSDGFNETPLSGAGNFALTVQGRDTASVPAFIGLRFGNMIDIGRGLNLRPVVSVAYGHDFAPVRILNNDLLALPDATFQINGASIARDFAQTKAGFELGVAMNTVIFANFEGEFSGRDQLYGGKGGIKVTW